MKRLTYYFKGYIKETIFGPLFKLLEASFELLVPIVIAKMIDETIPRGDRSSLLLQIGLIFFLAAVGVVVAITAQYYSSKAAVGYTRQLTEDLYQKVMSLGKKDRDELGTASLITRLTADTFQIQTGLNQFLRLFLRAPIIVFGAIIMAFSISPSLTIWFLVMVVTLFIIVFVMSRLLNPIYLKIRTSTDYLVKLTRQQLQGVRVIRAFNQVDRESEAFNDINYHYTNLQLKAGRLSSLVTPLTFLVVNITLVVIIWRGNLNIANHLLSQGMLVALINYLLQILVELLKMTMLVTSLNQSYISAKRIIAVFERPSEIIDDKLEPKYSNKALEVQEMAFSYPNSSEKALSDITFSMNVGETLGIIGGTGSGKSTLVNLLLHIYKVQEGDIDIYHQGKSPDTISNWRTLVRVVPQNAQLFKGTIRSNLSLGLGKVSEEKLWTALEIAQASDFVKEKDGQLDAPVESFGRNFSGGQRQRLTIARALVQDKIPFLILDDATSALDYLTEARLFKAITKHFNQTNLIIVSQRINSIQNADRILLLDKGKQVSFDNHQSLLAHNKVYKSIYHSQNFKEEE
ncbi:TPA: ABC transporter ATP-binding protein [Streptococcus agalactiae]